jgi:hypothetical protein
MNDAIPKKTIGIFIMRFTLVTLGTAVLFLLTMPATSAMPEENETVQEMVDKLRTITNKARKKRAADRWLLADLEDLIAHYDWPWRNELLSEDFSDGDYQQDPTWKVVSGEFWVDSRLGLRSRSHSRIQDRSTIEESRDTEEDDRDMRRALLGALLQGALGPEKRKQRKSEDSSYRRRNEPAEIELPLRIPTTFALQTEFSIHNAPSEAGEQSFSLIQDQRGDYGYQLVIQTGQQHTIELLSILGGRISVIKSAQLEEFDAAQSHTLEWRHDAFGQIEILLDDNSIIRARDRSFRQPFERVSIFNKTGDFAVRSLLLFGGNN